jgi:hemoglobin
MDISAADFNAVVEILQKAMEQSDISLSAQNRLLAKLAPMRADMLHQ